MSARPRFRIVMGYAAEEHLALLPARGRRRLLDTAQRQLAYEPMTETRHRKRMRPNPVAPWELRVGRMRVYFDRDEPALVVTILAVGIKDRERILIGSRRVDLK